jgi:hypothetical protein
MKVKRIKKIKINCYTFNIKWTKEHNGGSFSYGDRSIEIGIKDSSEDELFMVICHELMEIVSIEMNVRFRRPDCETDFLFVYDHRQHETMMNMFSSLVSKFL